MPYRVYAKFGRAGALTRTGARLRVAPSRTVQLAAEFGGGVLGCFGAALAGLFLVVICGLVLAHSVLPAEVVLEIVLGVGVVFGGASAYSRARNLVRWVEFRPAPVPTHAMVAGMGRSRVVPLAELERVAVTERLTLGERTSLTVVLYTRDGTDVVCSDGGSYGVYSPLKLVGATKLTDWLTAVLEPAGVPVRYERILERSNRRVEDWYSTPEVAFVWQIPPQAVPETAQLWNVSFAYFQVTKLPNTSMRYQEKHGPVYDPDAVHEAAERMRLGLAPLERVTSIGAESEDEIRDSP